MRPAADARRELSTLAGQVESANAGNVDAARSRLSALVSFTHLAGTTVVELATLLGPDVDVDALLQRERFERSAEEAPPLCSVGDAAEQLGLPVDVIEGWICAASITAFAVDRSDERLLAQAIVDSLRERPQDRPVPQVR